jgi:prepilin-type processing-associated H-X9-DG protein
MRRCDGFTLAETLVIGSIGFLLLGLLLPSLNDAKQTLEASQCLNNLREWGLAFGMYCNDNQDYMPDAGGDTSATPLDQDYMLGAWFNVVSRYINQPPLKDLYYSTPPRIPVVGTKSVYICPSVKPGDGDPYPAGPAGNYGTPSKPLFTYAMNRLLTGALASCPGNRHRRSSVALPAQTPLICDSDNWWNYSFTDGGYLGTVTPRHNGGINISFVDGHAEWVAYADYARSGSMGYSAYTEWIIKGRPIYWFACPTCDKSCSSHW